MANITECNRLITLDHIRKFIEDLIQDESGNTVTVDLGDYPLTYCPTYSQLTDETFVPFFEKDPEKLSLDKDGIDVSGAYSTNQNTVQGDLKVNFTRFGKLGISADTYTVDSCTPSIVDLFRNLLYDRNVKTPSDNCETSTIATSSFTDSQSEVDWHHNPISGVSIDNEKVYIQPIGGNRSREIIVSADTEFRESSMPSTPRELVITQSGTCCDCSSIEFESGVFFATNDEHVGSTTYEAQDCVTVGVASNVAWLSANTEERGVIQFHIDENTNSARIGTITVTSTDGECTITAGTITVSQESGCSCNNFYGLSQTAITITSGDSSTHYIEYNADSCVTISASTDADWLTTSVSGNSITLRTTENTNQSREATVNVYSSYGTCTKFVGSILVTQERGCSCENFYNLETSSITFDAKDNTSSSITYSADSCVTVNVVVPASASTWLSAHTSGDSIIQVSADINSGASRSSTIDVTSTFGECTRNVGSISVTQKSGCTCYDFYRLSTDSVTFESGNTYGANISYSAANCVTVRAIPNVDWLTTSVNNWIFIAPTSINTSHERHGEVTITSSAGECTRTVGTISVTQLSGCSCDNYYGVSQTAITIASGDTNMHSIGFDADSCVTISTSTDADWLATDVRGNDITLRATEINTSNPRETTINVYSSYGDCVKKVDEILVRQNRGCSCENFYDLETSSITFDANTSEYQYVKYSADTCVEVSANNYYQGQTYDWIQAIAHDVDQIIQIRVGTNTGSSRTGYVEVLSTFGNCQKHVGLIEVSQESGCTCYDFYSLSTTSLTFDSGDNGGFLPSAMVAYSAADCVTVRAIPNVDWLTASVDGTRKQITVSPTSANTSHERHGEITVTSTVDECTRTVGTISVTQLSGCSCNNFYGLSQTAITIASGDTNMHYISFSADPCVTVSTSTDADWLPTDVSGNNITLRATENINQTREATVYVNSAYGNCKTRVGSILVTQERGCSCENFYGLETSSITFDANSSEYQYVKYSADTCVEVGVRNQYGWIRKATVDSNQNRIQIGVDTNTGSSRTGYIEVTSTFGECIKKVGTIEVNQGSGCTCHDFYGLSTSSVTFSSADTSSEIISYSAAECVEVVASSNVNWLSVSVDNYEHYITLTPLSGNTSLERHGEVTVISRVPDSQCEILAGTISVTQLSGCSCENFYGLSQTSITIASGDTNMHYIPFSADPCVTVSAKDYGTFWLSATTSGNNIVIRATEINTRDAREVYVDVASEYGTCTKLVGRILVTQECGCSYNKFYHIDTNSLEFAPSGGTQYVGYSADSCVGLSTSVNADWLQAYVYSGQSEFRIDASENLGSERRGTVVITSTACDGSGQVATINVIQQDRCTCEDFYISQDTLYFRGSYPDVQRIQYIKPNCVTSITASSSENWIDTFADENVNEVIIHVSNNNTSHSRFGYVYVEVYGLRECHATRIIPIEQSSGCTIETFGGLETYDIHFDALDTEKYPIHYSGGSCITFSGYCDADWITWDVDYEKKCIYIQPEMNITSSRRTARLFLQIVDGFRAREIDSVTIIQETGCTCYSIVYLNDRNSNMLNNTRGNVLMSAKRSSMPLRSSVNLLANDNEYEDVNNSKISVILNAHDVENVIPYEANNCSSVNATSNVSWLNVDVDTWNKNIVLLPMPNSGEPRNATVIVTSNDGECTITPTTISVTQESACTCDNFSGFTPTEVIFGAKETIPKTITYRSDDCINVSAKCDEYWLTVITDTIAKKITLIPSTNNDDAPRTAIVDVVISDGEIMITGGTITVTQYGVCSCHDFGELAATSVTLDSKGSIEKGIPYTADDCIRVSTLCNVSWLKISIDTFGKTIWLLPKPNTSGMPRTAKVDVLSSGDDSTITVGTIIVTQESDIIK